MPVKKYLFVVDQCNDCLYIYKCLNKQEGKTMVIGGYSMQDDGVHGITVKQYESGWSFYLDGDAATIFRNSWENWQLSADESFENFIYSHDYNLLFQ